MSDRRGGLICFGAGVLLWWLVGQANHLLTPWRVAVFAGGLGFVWAALHLAPRTAWIVALALGAWHDAVAPVAFGTHVLLFAGGCAVTLQVRERMPREEPALAVGLALVLNLAIFLALSVLHVGHAPDAARAWGRLFVDLLGSQVAVALVAPWFFALQRVAFMRAGVRLPAEGTRTS